MIKINQINNCNVHTVKILESSGRVNNEISRLKNELNAIDQYSHPKNLIIYGIPGGKREYTHGFSTLGSGTAEPE